jgi:hypothetical protein
MDLSKRETRAPSTSRPQATFREETTLPRANTDLPGLEVNAQIHRADMSGAEELSRILGLGTKVAENIAGDVQDNKDNADAAAATLDFATGKRDDPRFAKSRAYRDAWQLQGAKKLAVDVSTEVTEKFNEALNDPDHPATLADLDSLFEKTVQAHLVDEHGQPLDFITPQAKATLGNALAKLKMDLMPQAAKAIKTQTDTKLFATTFSNMLQERTIGQPIGTPPGVQPVAPIAPYYSPERSKPIPKGWKGNQEDAIRELGMTADEAAQFLKTGKDPRNAPGPGSADRSSIKALIAQAESSGSESASNPLSSASGLYGITDGTFKSLGGNLSKKNDPAEQERVMDRLLSKNEAALTKAGVRLTPGTIYLAHFLGAAGAVNALKNPDAAVAAKVQKANPFTRGWQNSDVIAWAQRKMSGVASGVVVADGSEPTLETAAAAQPLRPGFDVEGFISSLPPSVDKGEAKAWLLDNLFAQATSTGDASLLNGLENSTRKDGSPSFTPDERLKIAENRDRIEEHARAEADQKQRQLQQDNQKLVLQAMVDGKPPSTSWMAEQSRKGLLDPQFVYTMWNHEQEQARSEAAEARAEARAAQAQEDNDIDSVVLGMVAQRHAGDLAHSSFQDDLKLAESGALGTGKKKAARLLQLMAATKVGETQLKQDPDYAYWSGALRQNFKPRKVGGSMSLILAPKANISEATYQAMMALYAQEVRNGKKPADAYDAAVKRYAPQQTHKAGVSPELASVRAQMDALRKQRAAALGR